MIKIVGLAPRPIVPPVIAYRVVAQDAIGANVIPPAVTLPLTVTVPAVPLAPNTAMLEDVLGQATFVVPFHQFVPEAEVLQVPVPSWGPVVETDESQVTWPGAVAATESQLAAAKIAIDPSRFENPMECIKTPWKGCSIEAGENERPPPQPEESSPHDRRSRKNFSSSWRATQVL